MFNVHDEKYERYIEQEFEKTLDDAYEKIRYAFPLYVVEIAHLLASGWQNDVKSANMLIEELNINEKEIWAILGDLDKFTKIIDCEVTERYESQYD